MTAQTSATLDCGHAESPHSAFTRGYGTRADGTRHCYDCCAEHERQRMIESGRATLYLTSTGHDAALIDWPGNLRFPARYGYIRKGRHNIARVRYDTWFAGPDGFIWHATQYGDDTQIAHCKRTKERAPQNI